MNNTSLTPPDPFRGRGKIKLIILGQDPTVQDPEYKKKIKVTLLLNQPGGLRGYDVQKRPTILPEGGRPGLRHRFYRQQMDGYLAFMKDHIEL